MRMCISFQELTNFSERKCKWNEKDIPRDQAEINKID